MVPQAERESSLYQAIVSAVLSSGAHDCRDDESALADALASLMYWARDESEGADFESALERARSYVSEGI